MTAATSWQPPGPAWLFCPADRPERYAKAAAAADVVILDLEDGVAPADKAAARTALVSTPLDPERTVVRVNAVGTDEHALDLLALADTRYRRVMLPKTESAEQLSGLADYEVIALIESPLGALAVGRAVLARNAIGVMWGAEDLVAGLGGTGSRHADGSYRDVARHVRSTSLLAAKAYGKLALDSVYLDIADLDGLRAEVEDAVAVGFDVKVAIHPSQVPVIRAAYAPAPAEIDWARRVLAAVPDNRGVFAFEGRMVDGPVLRHAEQILRRAGQD
ncbi:HpcH/HpaI aldolase/citrate lyase family protein [Nocardia farcinica]|uniref:HpcH/HpaI aldolase/citrate lyase family protein n=1 Tax=Nocardia farcinica TaxID=37329 RepID=UPI001894200B|nr:CoA ester lyase [Nocardia farcinica]MBF6259335.1 CoA ester lyase [Nocardia farcinica]MBF6269694.1 CoA ester lyase [Nocardia farcinica]MBF6294644.1 CoA ester lyase [Nocardia farcinica]MBF6379656.1 CoA ester lyase [Nocardia farcinica]MBF6538781.1 CoA ester lyase [Nocardia farcinica]